MPIVSGGGGGGGTPFNGGTITNPLTIDVGALATAGGLEITGTSGANVKRLGVDFLHTLLSLTGDGVLTLESDDTLGVSMNGTSNSGSTLSVANLPSGDGVSIGSDGISATIGGATLLQALTGTGIRFHYIAAPADGTLQAGDCALWFDQTNGVGNTKLMVKGKSADGTVKTASIVLA